MNSHVNPKESSMVLLSAGDKRKILEQELSRYHSSLRRIEIQTRTVLTSVEHLPVHYLRCDAPHPIFNPSVVDTGDHFVFMSRCSSLRRIRDCGCYYASHPHDTTNVLHTFSHGLEGCRVQWLDDELLRTSCPAAQYGVEDCRLFMWNGELWAIGAGIRPDQHWGLMATQVLFKIQAGRVCEFVPLPSFSGLPEKNWTPHVINDRLFIIYCLSPTTVYEYRDGKLYLQFKAGEGDYNFDTRGGTQLVPWNGFYIGVAHDALISIDKRYYCHRFLAFDQNLNVIDIGEPFFIQKRGTEFACGLARSGDDLILSYGVSDRVSAYCILPPAVIDRWVAL